MALLAQQEGITKQSTETLDKIQISRSTPPLLNQNLHIGFINVQGKQATPGDDAHCELTYRSFKMITC